MHPKMKKGAECYAFFVGPHIAIGAEGKVMRPGRSAPSGACGALQRIHSQLTNGKVSLSDETMDWEQVKLQPVLLGDVTYGGEVISPSSSHHIGWFL